MSDTISPPFEAHLTPPEPSKGEREYQAFLRLLPQLLSTHSGKYVVIHEGQMVDSDSDDIVLIQRVHARVGYVPIYVGLVTNRPLVLRVRTTGNIRSLSDIDVQVVRDRLAASLWRACSTVRSPEARG